MENTRTFVTVSVSARTYDEIAGKLQEAGYGQAFLRHIEPPMIDMHGLALERRPNPIDTSGPATLTINSPHSAFTVKTALLRAAFHLRKQGYGKDDVEMADIIDQLDIKVEPK